MSDTTTTTTPDTTTTHTDESDALHMAIVNTVGALAVSRKAVVKAIAAAKKADLWKVRGFASWTAYLHDTLVVGGDLPGMTKDDRKFIAVSLVHFGMSQRDAAAITALSQPTVQRAAVADGETVGAEIVAATGDASDAKASATVVSKSGKVTAKDAPKGKGKPAAPKVAAPVDQPKRRPSAVASDAMATIEGAWLNLTTEQRDELFDRMGTLYASKGE